MDGSTWEQIPRGDSRLMLKGTFGWNFRGLYWEVEIKGMAGKVLGVQGQREIAFSTHVNHPCLLSLSVWSLPTT